MILIHSLFFILYALYFLFQTPSSEQEWENVAQGFMHRWNLPHVIGAVDGKHIRIRCPKNSGSLFHNYKGYFSVVLMGVVDHDYKFIYAHVGAEGRASDSRIWRDSDFFQDVDSAENVLHIPEPSHVAGMEEDLPYYFVGDDAFALGFHLMKPFPSSQLTFVQRIFNYRLSRCRRIVENAFGILSSRFRIFMRQQDMEPPGVQLIVMCTIALHNFLRSNASDVYMPVGCVDYEDRQHNVVTGQWRQQRQLDAVIGHQVVRNRSMFVKNMRLSIANWCVSRHGEVKWQYRIIQH
jgi:hypothetical protein